MRTPTTKSINEVARLLLETIIISILLYIAAKPILILLGLLPSAALLVPSILSSPKTMRIAKAVVVIAQLGITAVLAISGTTEMFVYFMIFGIAIFSVLALTVFLLEGSASGSETESCAKTQLCQENRETSASVIEANFTE